MMVRILFPCKSKERLLTVSFLYTRLFVLFPFLEGEWFVCLLPYKIFPPFFLKRSCLFRKIKSCELLIFRHKKTLDFSRVSCGRWDLNFFRPEKYRKKGGCSANSSRVNQGVNHFHQSFNLKNIPPTLISSHISSSNTEHLSQ